MKQTRKYEIGQVYEYNKGVDCKTFEIIDVVKSKCGGSCGDGEGGKCKQIAVKIKLISDNSKIETYSTCCNLINYAILTKDTPKPNGKKEKEMNKFKLGDKVKIREGTRFYSGQGHHGVGIIDKIYGTTADLPYGVEFRGYRNAYDDSDLELDGDADAKIVPAGVVSGEVENLKIGDKVKIISRGNSTDDCFHLGDICELNYGYKTNNTTISMKCIEGHNKGISQRVSIFEIEPYTESKKVESKFEVGDIVITNHDGGCLCGGAYKKGVKAKVISRPSYWSESDFADKLHIQFLEEGILSVGGTYIVKKSEVDAIMVEDKSLLNKKQTFNVGDKVKVIARNHGTYDCFKIGDIGVIESTNCDSGELIVYVKRLSDGVKQMVNKDDLIIHILDTDKEESKIFSFNEEFKVGDKVINIGTRDIHTVSTVADIGMCIDCDGQGVYYNRDSEKFYAKYKRLPRKGEKVKLHESSFSGFSIVTSVENGFLNFDNSVGTWNLKYISPGEKNDGLAWDIVEEKTKKVDIVDYYPDKMTGKSEDVPKDVAELYNIKVGDKVRLTDEYFKLFNDYKDMANKELVVAMVNPGSIIVEREQYGWEKPRLGNRRYWSVDERFCKKVYNKPNNIAIELKPQPISISIVKEDGTEIKIGDVVRIVGGDYSKHKIAEKDRKVLKVNGASLELEFEKGQGWEPDENGVGRWGVPKKDCKKVVDKYTIPGITTPAMPMFDFSNSMWVSPELPVDMWALPKSRTYEPNLLPTELGLPKDKPMVKHTRSSKASEILFK